MVGGYARKRTALIVTVLNEVDTIDALLASVAAQTCTPDEVVVVDIKGEVTAACEPMLMSAYEVASDGRTNRLVLNFVGLEYMNSGGIGMLVTLLVRANRQHQQLAQREQLVQELRAAHRNLVARERGDRCARRLRPG